MTIEASLDCLVDVRELLEKHSAAEVLKALAQFSECLADHMREENSPNVAERLSKAVDSLHMAASDIESAENRCGINLADAAEVFIA